APLLSDPRGKVVVGTATHHANPEDKLSTIDRHSQNIQYRLEEYRDQAGQVAHSIYADEDEGNASHGAMDIDIPVMPQNTERKKQCCEDSHQGLGPRCTTRNTDAKSKDESDFDTSHENCDRNNGEDGTRNGPVLVES
ncbi:hypothetical protein LTR28_011471, partial [Elasticomyces elasticus]